MGEYYRGGVGSDAGNVDNTGGRGGLVRAARFKTDQGTNTGGRAEMDPGWAISHHASQDVSTGGRRPVIVEQVSNNDIIG